MAQESRNLSETAENYIIEIYRLQEQNKRIIKLNEIVKRLRVPSSTATEMIQRLASKKYLQYTPFKGVKLTNKGVTTAQNLIRRHRIIERFLTDVLEIKPAEAHIEACKLEHYMSPLVENKIYKILQSPKYCPHGNTINTEEKAQRTPTVYDLEENRCAKIQRFLDEREDILEILYSLDLNIGLNIKVIKKYEDKILISVDNSSKPILLDKSLAEKISVTTD
ncbi:MAG: metal-dependent transcriptional regulator [Candidatus Odinarchaeia archaeon]